MIIRPVVNIIGKLVIAMGAMMVIPAIADWVADDAHWQVFLTTACVNMLVGLFVVIASHSRKDSPLTIRQGFLLTSGIWLVIPALASVPFMMGAPRLAVTDAFFEAMSGITTTGTTVLPALDGLPDGINLWRAMLNWMGGLGIVVVAVAFLPAMRVGGMQFFRSEGFDTGGKSLPRASDIAAEMTKVYVGITALATVAFIYLGMTPYDALVHALTACSTGGFSNYDASFAAYSGPAEYAAVVFMLLGSIPFIRLTQVFRGETAPILRDTQIHAYLRWIAYAVMLIMGYRLITGQQLGFSDMLRETVFNVVSIFSGTGFSSADVTSWGKFPFVVLIIVGLVGGCTGSTGCSVKVFRYQVLMQAVRAQLRRMHSPHRVYPVQMEGRALTRDVIDSVMAFFTMFMLTFGLLIMALAMTGLHPTTALTGAWSSIANIGPVFGPDITANGSVEGLPAAAKWLMAFGMYLGRLELVAFFVLLLPRFWRA